jgi:uncharacterized membrane protein YraQ (UPF0718 family)
MTTISLASSRIRCYYRPLILGAGAALILSVFWFTSRYPQLFVKQAHVGQDILSMAWSSEVLHAATDAPVWQQILVGAVNWLASMRVGMTFGISIGALLHTYLRYYPLKIGNNLTLNSLKGALVGVPAGVCANCSVPMACGVTRGNGRVEVALGFLFSSPNFNPVVVAMTFAALPLAMSITKYVILLAVILLVVPMLIRWLEKDKPLEPLSLGSGEACAVRLSAADCTQPFGDVLQETLLDYLKNVWMLVKPTVTLMLLASLVSSTLITLIPWESFLSEATLGRVALASVIATFMPVPIALDVMFAAQLQNHGVAPGYVMLFAMTLGTYSIIPSIYLWREVSRKLAVALFAFFVLVGIAVGLCF